MGRTALALALVLAVLMFNVSVAYGEVGRATVFVREGSKKTHANCHGEPIKSTDLAIAHRWLKCGTKVRVTSLITGKSVEATVQDRGTYGSCQNPDWFKAGCKGYKIKIRPRDPGIWKGIADLTPAVASAIGHKSHWKIRIDVIR